MGMDLVYAVTNGGLGLNKMAITGVYKYEENFIATSNCGLQMGFIWEMGLREYKF